MKITTYSLSWHKFHTFVFCLNIVQQDQPFLYVFIYIVISLYSGVSYWHDCCSYSWLSLGSCFLLVHVCCFCCCFGNLALFWIIMLLFCINCVCSFLKIESLLKLPFSIDGSVFVCFCFVLLPPLLLLSVLGLLVLLHLVFLPLLL